MPNPWAAPSLTPTSTTAHKSGGVRLWAVAVWLVVWQLGTMAMAAAFPHGALLLPSLFAVAGRLWELARTAPFWGAVAVSAVRIFGGFLAACLLASALAALSARFRAVGELLSPLLAAVKTVPVASFIILALVWLPTRRLSTFIAFLMVFPVVYGNVLSGILETDGALVEMARVFRVPLARQVRGIYVPQVLPYFRTACSVGLGLCWKAGIAAEVIGLPAGTIGAQLYNAKVYFETADLFAWTAAIVAVSVGIERLFLHLVDAAAGKVRRAWN